MIETERADPDAALLALRLSEQRYRAIVEGALDTAIFTLDPDGLVETWSPGAGAVLGWSEQEAVGRHFAFTFINEDVASGVPSAELRTARERGVAPDIRWHCRKNEGRVFIDGTTHVLRGGDGAVTGFLKIGRDITERWHLERSLVQLNEALQAGVQARTQQLEAAQDARARLRRQLAITEEEERRRLARELHDEVGQHLTALALGLRALSDLAMPGSEVDRRATQLRELVGTLSRELHRVAVRLRPAALDDFGLEAAVTAAAENWSAYSGIAVDLHVDVGEERLPEVTEGAIYRITQEALTNVARHSGATRASVLLERTGTELVLVIEDNGRGFNSALAGSGPRLGLRGIQERAALLGGVVELETQPGSGTSVFVRVPLSPAGPAPLTLG